MAEDVQGTWDVQYGDRRIELVCIGRKVDHGAASAQLEACLLTAEEMAGGQESWLQLTDPFAKEFAGRGGRMVSGVSEANLRKFMEVTGTGDCDDIFGFMFETLGEESWLSGDREHATKQIEACGAALRDVFGSSDDKPRTQRVILMGVASLVTSPKHGETMLKKVPAILMALYAPLSRLFFNI